MYLLLLLVILYSQVLSGILVSGNRVIFFVCVFFVYILREVRCKFIIIYQKIKKITTVQHQIVQH